MIRRSFPAVFVALLALQTNAQIAEIGSMINGYEIYTLRSAGVKLIGSTGGADTVTIYNPDLTVYLNVPIQPPVAPYTAYSSWYFSEDLFDNDPTTIEYLVGYYYTDSVGQGHSMMSVYRTDGTQLFSADSVFMEFTGLLSAAEANEPIFNTPLGTRMVLIDNAQHRHIYSLPGVLPCPSCDGSLNMGTGGEHMAGSPGHIDLFPNPARSSVMVNYELLPGANQGQLCFFDMQGQIVKRVKITEHSGQLTVDTSGLASGNYSCRIETNAGFMAGPQMMVVR